MNTKRELPFGYRIRNGILSIDSKEADAVRWLFTAYLEGASLNELAKQMTQQRVPYYLGNTTWNKNMVSRILENPRYAGANNYPPIVSDVLAASVRAEKRARNTKVGVITQTPTRDLHEKVYCDGCGSPMTRIYEKRNREPVFWRCTCKDCCSRVTMADDLLESKIVERMNEVISTPELLEDADSYRIDDEETTQRAKITAELSRMCDSGNYTDEQLLAMILGNAQKRYALCPEDRSAEAAQVSIAYNEATPSPTLNTELFQKTVKHILLSADGSIHLRLTSEKEI